MIQYRIANSIKKLETIEDSLQFFESAKKQEEECLSNLISTYMQQCTAEENQDGISSLIRYLYWYTDFKPSVISEITGIDNRTITKRAGDLVFSASCSRCQTSFANRRTSRTDQGSNLCPACQNADILDSHKVFLEDWIDSSWATHKNPKMDQGTYAAYLHSQHWKKTRGEALQRASYRCQACSAKDEILDVHHNSYDRLGAEDPSDLIVLCRPCHSRIHSK